MPIPDAQPPPEDVVMADNANQTPDVCSLKDLKSEIKAGVTGVCFWIYLPESTQLPATLIRQVHPDGTSSDMLSLDEQKRPLLWPLLFGHDESPHPSDTSSKCILGQTEFPLGRWVHLGYQISSGSHVLHINGKIVLEKFLSSSFTGDSGLGTSKNILLLGADDNLVDGYIYNTEVLYSTLPIKEHYVKDPPLQLSISLSFTSEVDEDNEGIWNIVGGKPTGRRSFTVGVVLLDALGRPAVKDMEVAASLLHAENGTPVETPFDAEAPLLTSYDGVEFASSDKLIKLQNGHASFKFKMALLSSKCDNKLFRIKFFIPNSGAYPFFAAYSPPIRSISRSRKSRIQPDMVKISSSVVHTNGSQSLGLDNGHPEITQHAAHGAVSSKQTPQVKSFEGKPPIINQRYSVPVRGDEEVNSPSQFNGQVLSAPRMLSKETLGCDETHIPPSNSESTEEETLERKGMSGSGSGRKFSDECVFKYCLGGLDERANILKELAISASDQELTEFAQQVSLYSGCSHHWSQIAITKKLIGDGIRLWNIISQDNEPVRWENVVLKIQKRFTEIANTTRSLSEQDLSFLRRVSGCQGYFAHEHFEKMWSWLYPVAFTLSRSSINSLWSSTPPYWIEGFITKEEAERSLQGSRGLQQPGTFILRFPTSRSWPHPDAGSLVVTYVGSDCTLHHRLISLDYIHRSAREKNAKSVQDMILNEPELSRLGRVIRSQ